jgi:hypothetical protein
MNTTTTTTQLAVVATMIGNGTKIHLVEATVEEGKYYQRSVACGSGIQNSPFRRSIQHGNIVLSATHEVPETDDYLVKNPIRLVAWTEAIANLADLRGAELCSKCEKEAHRLVAFWTKQGAAA